MSIIMDEESQMVLRIMRERNAYRDRCAELRDALRWALNQIEDDLDPDHQAALAAALELAENS